MIKNSKKKEMRQSYWVKTKAKKSKFTIPDIDDDRLVFTKDWIPGKAIAIPIEDYRRLQEGMNERDKRAEKGSE